MILKEEINKNTYVTKLTSQHPKVCSGRKNYNEFEHRITKNILLIKLFIKKKDIKFIMKSEIKIEISRKTAKLVCT